MLIRLPLTKPASVTLAFFAISNPESKAAPNEDTIGIPTLAALKMISPDKRPVEAKNNSPNLISLMAAIPITLSTALWRPTSSDIAICNPLEV